MIVSPGLTRAKIVVVMADMPEANVFPAARLPGSAWGCFLAMSITSKRATLLANCCALGLLKRP
jgi:hypothetical protein